MIDRSNSFVYIQDFSSYFSILQILFLRNASPKDARKRMCTLITRHHLSTVSPQCYEDYPA